MTRKRNENTERLIKHAPQQTDMEKWEQLEDINKNHIH